MTRIYFTSVNNAYLTKAAVLARSLKAFNPSAWFVLSLLDEVVPEALDAVGNPFDEVLSLREILPGGVVDRSWIFQHTVVEACTAVKPSVAAMLLERPDVVSVTYLDPDINVYSSFSQLEQLLDEQSVVLTPHVTSPALDRADVLDHEVSSLRHGAYNLGFFAVSDSESARQFLAWWAERMRHYCVDDLAGGLFTDQKWIDLAPGLFSGVHVLRDSGHNVATWNIRHREIQECSDGTIEVNGDRLVFAHFSGFDSGNHATMLSRYAETSRVFSRMSGEYAEELEAMELRMPALPEWRLGHYDDGASISLEARRKYRFDQSLQDKFPDPYACGPASLREWMRAYDNWAVSQSPERIAAGELDADTIGPYSASVRALSRILREPESRAFNPSDIANIDEILIGYRDGSAVRQTPRGARQHGFEISDTCSRLRAALDPALPNILFVTLPGGGVANHVSDLADLLVGKANVISVVSEGSGANHLLRYSAPRISGAPSFAMWQGSAQQEFDAVFAALGVAAVHVHHRFGCESLLRYVESAKTVPYVVTLHDYCFVSPEPHLAGADGRFVGEPIDKTWRLLAAASRKYEVLGAEPMHALDDWAAFLNGAECVIAPSRDCGERYVRMVPGLNVTLAPHLETGYAAEGSRATLTRDVSKWQPSDQVCNVIMIGEYMESKGARVAEEVAHLAHRSGLQDVHFLVLGGRHFGDRAALPNQTFYGAFDRRTMSGLLGSVRPSVGWLPSQVPETYGYALSEMMNLRIPIVASRIGAFGERLEGYAAATLVDWQADPRVWLEYLLSARASEAVPGFSHANVVGAYYPQEYLRLLRTLKVLGN
jgi:glycosyltransferase involved in cell wall biosynthesis